MKQPCRSAVVALSLSLGTIGAGTAASAQEAPVEESPPAVTGPAEAVEPEKVSFSAEDGMELHGDLYLGSDPSQPTVILMHDHLLNRADWAILVPALTEAGFNVLNYDLRGHGESVVLGERTLRAEDVPIMLARKLWMAGVLDVEAALALLEERGVQTDRVALIAAHTASLTALLAAVPNAERIRALVFLSGINQSGSLIVTPYAKKFPGEIMTLVDRGDPIAAPGTDVIVSAHPGPEIKLEVKKGGRGVEMIRVYPRLRPVIVDFLRKVLDAR